MIQRNTTPIRMRNYGRIIQDTIAYACTLPDNEERKALVLYIAQCMRQKNLIWNRDQESGVDRIKADLLTLSNGVLDVDLGQMQAVQPQQQKKKKK